MRIDDARLHARFAADAAPDVLEALVLRYRPLARSLARRYAPGRVPAEDLEQTALVGLVKALRRFDPGRETSFTSFAIPTILGEIRRHRRESIWPVHVPRAVQERSATVRRTADAFTAARGRPPGVAELARALACPEEDVLDAVRAAAARSVVPLEAPCGSGGEEGASAIDRLGAEDPGYALVEDLACVSAAVGALTHREREALRLRFAEDLTHPEIARRMGVAEARAGRLVATALDRLRAAAVPGAGVAA